MGCTYKEIAISDATFFPSPNPSLYRAMKGHGETAKHIRFWWGADGLLVGASVARFEDGREWLHVSFSRKSRIPDYDDLMRVKREFFGDRKAVMVFPEAAHYVNIMPYCLNLWWSPDDPLPNFDHDGSI